MSWPRASFALVPVVALIVGAMTPFHPARADAPGARLRVVLGGDVMLGRGVAERARTRGWTAALVGLSSVIHSADLSIVHLESPLAACLPGGTVERPRLCGEPDAVDALVAAGVSAVTVSGNHALDAGEVGLRATVAALRARGIVALGVEAALTGVPVAERVGSLVVVAANATPVALEPGRSIGVPGPQSVARAIASGRRSWPDLPVLVLLHAGREGWPWPSERDGDYAQSAVRVGASAVAMHGAHRVRPLVSEHGVPVHLGLGNLLFDQRAQDAAAGELLVLSFAARVAHIESVRCTRVADGVATLVPCVHGAGVAGQ